MTGYAGNIENSPVEVSESSIDSAIDVIVNALKSLYDNAFLAYRPLVEDICSRDATEREVDRLLDHLLDFAGEDRMLGLFKRVCRKYLYRYPEAVADHIYMWRDMYDEEYAET